MHRLRVSRGAAVLAVALLGVGAAAGPADAALKGQRSSPAVTTGSARWAAVPTAGTTAPTGTGALTLTFTALQTPRYISVFNTGTVALTGSTMTVTMSSQQGVTNVQACSAGWNETLGTCLGTVTTYGTSNAVSTTNTNPLAVGASVRLKVTPTGANGNGFTVGISTSVSRAQARAKTTTSS